VQAVAQNGQRRHEDVADTLEAIQQNGQRQHDDLMAYMKDLDRRHTELLAEIAKRP